MAMIFFHCPLWGEAVPFCFYHHRELDYEKQSPCPRWFFSNLRERRVNWNMHISQEWRCQTEPESLEVHFPRGRRFQEVGDEALAHPKILKTILTVKTSLILPASSRNALSWYFSEAQGGSREGISNFRARKNRRPRGPALVAATL